MTPKQERVGFEGFLDPHTVNERLEEIARLIRTGADPEDFLVEIDQLTGNTMEPRNHYEDQVWESEYRQEDK